MTTQTILKHKVKEYGIQSATDLELLQLILGQASADQIRYMNHPEEFSCCQSNTQLADKRLSSALPFHLLTLYEQEPEYFGLCGLPESLTVKLSAISEVSKRLWKASKCRNRRFNNASDVAEYYMQDLKAADYESVYIFLTDSRNQLIRSVLVAQGSVDACALSTREIIKTALMSNSVSSLVLCHNHPSGNPEPSNEDISFSRTLRDACKLFNLHLQDSVIIGDGRYFSLRESGLL